MNETLPSKKASSPGRSDRECTCCTRAGRGAGSPHQRSPVPGLTGRRSSQRWSSPQPHPVPSAPPLPHAALIENKALSPPDRVSRANWWSRLARSSTATAVGEPVLRPVRRPGPGSLALGRLNVVGLLPARTSVSHQARLSVEIDLDLVFLGGSGWTASRSATKAHPLRKKPLAKGQQARGSGWEGRGQDGVCCVNDLGRQK